jgi:hypothetical protein
MHMLRRYLKMTQCRLMIFNFFCPIFPVSVHCEKTTFNVGQHSHTRRGIMGNYWIINNFICINSHHFIGKQIKLLENK